MSFGFNCYKCGVTVHMSSKKTEPEVPREKQLCFNCWTKEKEENKGKS